MGIVILLKKPTGTYTISGNKITIKSQSGETITSTFSIDKDILRITTTQNNVFILKRKN